MKKAEKEDLYWIVNDICKLELIPQTDLTKGDDYSRGWVDACNLILKRIEGLKEE